APAGDGPIAECVARAPGGPVHVLVTDREAEHIPGCNMAFRTAYLDAVGGFDPRFRTAGDDVDVCWRLQDRGWTLGFHPAAMVWHHRRNSVRAYWRQQIGYGRAEAMLERKWPEKYNDVGHVRWRGTLTWLKKGAPTETFTPRAASERRGKTVPKKTVKVAATNSTLLRRKADSRDTIESSSPCAWSASQRTARRPRAVSSTSARKLRKNAPIVPCVKACTEAMTPERVRNVPKRVRLKVRITSEMFQSLSIRRRSWIITEWRNAVAVSHGMNAAF